MADRKENGLSQKEVEQRIQEGKVNIISEQQTRTVQEIITANVFTYFNLINLILFILVFITGSYKNGAFFLTIIFNDVLCIIQELHAKKMIDKLSILILADVTVLRDNTWQKIKVDKLVLDDIAELKSGMQIPADAIVLNGYLEVNESILTGESNSLQKHQGDTLLAGSVITAGLATVQIIHVGKDNFSETIMSEAKKYKPARSMLNKEINYLLKMIAKVIIPIGILLFVSQYFGTDLTWQEAILKTVSALVGMIPEGLIVLISIALAISTIRLSQKHVLIQDQFSIEALARVDTLCIDKTGTLTKGEMSIEDIILLDDINKNEVEKIIHSFVRSFPDTNATGNALARYVQGKDSYSVLESLPFSSDRKYSGIQIEKGSYFLGAPNILFHDSYDALKETVEKYTSAGSRVIVLAKNKEDSLHDIKKLDAIALISLKDTLRENVRDIIQYFYEQDVDIKVISGDDASTVSSLAFQAGIRNANDHIDMSTYKKDPFTEDITQYTVFGRVLPDQKKEMVELLQKQGHTVAMIGDGVNDIPALKEADVSVAMGNGASATKNSANIILLDSDFATMPQIVNEGRRVINNITRAASMFFVKTGFSFLLSIYVIVLQQSYPFLPIHLTLIGMFGVAVPTFILQNEPSFERVKENVLEIALRNAIPSSIVVFLSEIICNLLEGPLHISTERMHLIMIVITYSVYAYTLYKVYVPHTNFRKLILGSMAICMVLSVIFLRPLFQIEFAVKDLFLIIPLVICIPKGVDILVCLYDKVYKKIKKV